MALTWRRLAGGGGDADDLKKRTGPAAEVEAGFDAEEEEPKPLPPARWRHTATLTSQVAGTAQTFDRACDPRRPPDHDPIGDLMTNPTSLPTSQPPSRPPDLPTSPPSQTSLMIFGGYLSHDERLNDMWMFDTVSLEWSQLQANNPSQPASVYHLAHQDAAHKDVPAPRGGHSATLVGTDAVWLFGGYGGFGYSRKEMDDLYRLDIRSNSWQLIQPKGGGPEARSGHQCQAVQLKLLLHGGGWGAVGWGVRFWGRGMERVREPSTLD